MMMNKNFDLRYYQKDLIKKINNNNIIIVDWLTGQGVDYTLQNYLKNIRQTSACSACYIGYTIIYKGNGYEQLNLDYFVPHSFDLSFKYYDIIIVDRKRILTSEAIRFLSSKCNKLIIKTNLSDIDYDIGDYVVSDGTATKYTDRIKKMKRLIC
jgi:hypothetical protein